MASSVDILVPDIEGKDIDIGRVDILDAACFPERFRTELIEFFPAFQ